METPYCDVIGCTAHAQWFLVSELNGVVEEQHLCQRHWRQRLHEPARRIVRWSRAGQSGSRPAGKPNDSLVSPKQPDADNPGGQAHT